MIVNRRSKIGVFEKKDLVNEKGLLVLDFNNQEKNYLEDYLDWEVKGLSPNGANLALTTISSHRKSYRTDFVIIERISQRVLLNTHDYYVYAAEFNLKGDKILVVADNKKPFCYDLILNKITEVAFDISSSVLLSLQPAITIHCLVLRSGQYPLYSAPENQVYHCNILCPI